MPNIQTETRRESHLDWRRLIVGYLGAGAGAALVYEIIAIITLSLDRLSQIVSFGTYFGGGFWAAAIIGAVLSCIITGVLTYRFGFGGKVYYAAGGVVTAMVLALVYGLAVTLIFISARKGVLGFYVEDLIIFVFPGISGALVFWYLAGRHLHRSLTSTQVERRRASEGQWQRFIIGYLGAVAGAALVYELIWLGLFYYDLPQDRWVLPPWFIGAFGAAFGIVALFAALPFVAVSYAVALRFNIRNAIYYVVCGSFSAVILAPLYVWMLPRMFDSDGHTMLEDCLVSALWLVPAGISGAVIFWYLAGRHLGRATPVQRSH